MIQNTIIVRSANERTEQTCYSIIKQAFTDFNIEVIHEKPFSQAIKKSFDIALKNKSEWLLCIDADVLPNIEGIKALLDIAQNSSVDLFEIQGLVVDKFFPIKRPAGNHLYRTKYIHEAQKLIPKEGTSLRPEHDTLKAMAALGYKIQQTDIFVGLHDFEQNYKDIYRKCFVQAHKHNWIITEAEKYWNTLKEQDTDFQIAIWGTMSGKIYSDTVYIDKEMVKEEIDHILEIKKLSEKAPLHTDSINIIKLVDDKLSSHSNNKISSEFQEKMFPKDKWNETLSYNENKRPSLKQKLLWNFGKQIEKVGYAIKSSAKI
jgi:hypothetical protein